MKTSNSNSLVTIKYVGETVKLYGYTLVEKGAISTLPASVWEFEKEEFSNWEVVEN